MRNKYFITGLIDLIGLANTKTDSKYLNWYLKKLWGNIQVDNDENKITDALVDIMNVAKDIGGYHFIVEECRHFLECDMLDIQMKLVKDWVLDKYYNHNNHRKCGYILECLEMITGMDLDILIDNLIMIKREYERCDLMG